jgi:hypothetical protein
MTGIVLRLGVILPFAFAPVAPSVAEDGFENIFDGRTLDGWRGQDMSFWSVEDDAITGTISAEHAPPMNQYLVWQRELVDDFELKLDFRLTGSNTPVTNGGFQFRSRRLPNGDVAGYQVDNNFGQSWRVRLYDEFGRHDLALEGQRSVFVAEGRRQVEPLTFADGPPKFALDEWHEYHLACRGPHLVLKISGTLVAETTDNDPQQYEALGVLAMQLHTGPPQKAQFRNVRFKRLPLAEAISRRRRLLAAAALDWQLGKRVGAHQPPLTAERHVAPQQNAEGPGAHDGAKVAHLAEGYFNAGKAWQASGDALTVYSRVRVPDGNWNHALFAKRGDHEHVNFNLFSTDLPATAGQDIGFEIHTDRGFFQVSFPVAKIDATAWHDLVGRYDGRALVILCDGRPMAECPASGNLTQNDEPLLIGAETDRGRVVRVFSGEMEQASLWTRAISDEEMSLLLSR